MEPDPKSPEVAEARGASPSWLTDQEREQCQTIFKEHGPQLISMALAMLQSHEDADDAVQSLALQMPKLIRRYNATRHPLPFLKTYLNFEVLTIRRKKASREKRAKSAQQRRTSRAPSERQQELAEVFEVIARQLAPADLDIIRMKVLEGCTHADIATALNSTENKVRTRLIRILASLQRPLREFLCE